MAFVFLPNEILTQICSYLCFHCQNRGIFPNSNTKESRMEKITLAHICLVSKRLCSIAQPILFHYYASGNLARSLHIDLYINDYNGNVECWDLEDDKLLAFIRTLITRPSLAICIESLQLQGSEIEDICTPDIMRLLRDASRALNFKLPVGWCSEEWVGDDSHTNRACCPSKDNRHYYNLDFHYWLMGLAIALTPRTEMLMYMCEGSLDELDWFKDTKMVLPALKTLALRGAQGFDYYLFDIHPFVTAAPNLETLYALECNGILLREYVDLLLDENDGHSWTKNIAVRKLRKLVLTELRPEVFKTWIQKCVKLEDLEYYIHNWNNYPDIILAISQTTETLRRLCFGYLPAPVPGSYESRLDYDYTTITTLREFTQLEELVIDQAMLYLKSDSCSGTRLVVLFPPSIQRVHLTYVYKSMYDDLLSLALAASENFRKLRSVKIGLLSPIPPDRVVEIEHMKTVESAFVSAGIYLSWEENLIGPFLYTMIPGGAPGVTATYVPAATFKFP